MEEQKQVTRGGGKMTVPMSTGSDFVLTPKEMLGILRRHLMLIFSITVLGSIIGGAGWYLLLKYAPKYSAMTYIKVLPPTEKDPTKIGAAEVSKEIQYGHRLSIATLITEQSTLSKLIERDKIQQTKWFTDFGKTKAKRIARAMKDLKKRFGASAQRDGNFIVVSMTCGSKQESALIVNEMVVLFLKTQGSTKREEVSEKLKSLESERLRIQGELDAAEKALDDVRRAYNISDLEERSFEHTITKRLSDLELEQNQLMMEIKQIQANVATLEKQATGPVTEQVENQVERDSIMIAVGQQLVAQEARLAGLLTKFGENHRTVREAQELINKIREKRELRRAEIAEITRQSNLQYAQDNLVVLQSRLVELEKLRQDAEAKQRSLDMARVQYVQRKGIKDERKQMLDSIKEQIDKMKLMLEDPETPKVQFVGYAPEPLEISSPKWQIYFPGGIMLGFMLGVGLAFLIEILNDLVRAPIDVKKYLHIPLLGIIPDGAEDKHIAGIDLYHVVSQSPYSIISESYRRLRTNLKLSDSSEKLKVLLVSSSIAGDGKTSVAVNLATTFITENKKVLLIDANFWRPGLGKVFGKLSDNKTDTNVPDFGLSNLLMRQCGYEEVLRSSSIMGLDYISSGQLPSNPGELLGGAQIKELIKSQREIYDYIIIDGPPILVVSDVKTLAKEVDGTLLVFNASATKRGMALRTIRELREVNAYIIGCVLLGVKAMKGGYFSEQFKSYQEYQKPQLAHSI